MASSKSETTSKPLWKQAVGAAVFLWRLPKTPKDWFQQIGSAVGSYAVARERQHWEGLLHDFEGMDCFNLSKGAGQLVANWIVAQRETAPLEAHLSRLEAIIVALDETGRLPLERAITRLIASKAALALEGYTSKLGEPKARYQRYQQQAKALLSALPMKNYQGLSQKAIFLGKPFSCESVFMASHRVLDATCVEQTTDDLQTCLAKYATYKPNSPEAFYVKLLAQTYREEDAEKLSLIFETWFEAYQQFMLNRVKNREQWLGRGLRLLGAPLKPVSQASK